MFKWLRHIGFIGAIGIISTLVYAFALHCLVGNRWGSLKQMDLNELGDFLAGAFGPLAILWLVLGFFQQGIELRQNSLALNLQAQELKDSVAQQAKLALHAEEQLRMERENVAARLEADLKASREKTRLAQPILRIGSEGYTKLLNGKHRHQIKITNIGHSIREVKIFLDSHIAVLRPAHFLQMEALKGYSVEADIPYDHDEDSVLIVAYIDGEGNEKKNTFDVEIRSTNINFSVRTNTE